MPLTNVAIRSAKSGKNPLKFSDEKGLYLLLTPSGGKWWRFDSRYAGSRKTRNTFTMQVARCDRRRKRSGSWLRFNALNRVT